MGNRSFGIRALALAALLMVVAACQPTEQPGTISVCANSSGRMRLVLPEQKCRSTELRVAWNTEGRPGPTGASGPTGPIGLEGQVGPTGVDGAAGTPGAEGLQGLQGPPGPLGLQGLQGLQGMMGLQGTMGLQGLQGLPGTAGTPGNQGAQGTTGLPGAAGATGATGATGPTGATGATGPAGPTGSTGAQGPMGVASSTSGTTTGTGVAVALNAVFTPGSLTVPAAGTYLVTVSMNIVRTTATASEVSCQFGSATATPLMYATVPRNTTANGVLVNLTGQVTSSLNVGNQVVRLVCTNLHAAATYTWSVLTVAVPLGSAAGTTYTG